MCSIKNFILIRIISIFFIAEILTIIFIFYISKPYVFEAVFFIIFLFLTVWISIRKTISRIEKITKDINARDPKNLSPLSLDAVPSEIVPLIQELNRLFKIIKLDFKREKRFTADAAHELKTPLAAIRIQIEVAMNTHQAADRKIALKKSVQAIDRATHVVSQLLILNKLSSNKPIENPEPCNILAIMQEIISELEYTAFLKNIKISVSLKQKNIPAIQGDPISLGILFQNLIANAIQYTQNHGKIEIKLGHDTQNNTLFCQIRDNGPGIPNSFKKRVFDRFFRIAGHNSTGSGLGLSIVQVICKQHRAQISLHNAFTTQHQPTMGLLVKIIFPLI
jgi:two-component system sensor histidine kinase QseC